MRYRSIIREGQMGEFQAGAARSDITPRLGCHICGYFNDRIAEDILDPLYAKAIVLDNGEEAYAIVVCDLIALAKQDADAAKVEASRLTGIPAEHIFISCTHTHYGPATMGALGTPRDDAYMETAMLRVADSVRLAQNRLVPAEAGVASTSVPGETFNRRWHLKDGKVEANFRLGYESREAIRPAGPTDPEVLVMAVRDRDRQPIALLANYSLHYVGGPYDTSISADYFGHFDRALQRMAGVPLVGIMANGCCGDVNNIDISRPRPEMPTPTFQAERVANVLAGAAFSAWQGLRDRDYERRPALGVATETAPFRRREPTPDELQRARQLAARPKPPDDSPDLVPWVYAHEVQYVAEEPLERPMPITAWRVGQLGAVGLPGEMFVQYALQIKERSPFRRTMAIELANDCLGYFPTDRAMAEGSYELTLARSAKAAAGSEKAVVDAAVKALSLLAG